MPPKIEPSFNLHFKEALEHFAGKVLNLPTNVYTDILRHGHARAFVVAGAQKAELLADLHAEIAKAVSGGSYQQFKTAFRDIVKKHGWSYRGEEGWRTRTIYSTNISTAFAAGRWAQQTDPEVLKSRPYLRYRHNYYGTSIHPRADHVQWDNTILPASDPWWESHYPPNGWGCKCGVESVTESEASAIVGADLRVGPPPRPKYDGETVPWTNPSTGLVEDIPRGITPGWDYNPGQAKDMGDTAIWQSIKKCPQFIQDAFLGEMANGAGERYSGVLDDWIDDITSSSSGEYHPKGIVRTVGWMSPEVWNFVVGKRAEPTSPVISASDAGMVHAIGDRKASSQKLTPEQAKAIPQVLAQPEAVLWDTEEAALLYVFSGRGSDKGKIVVRFDRKHSGRDKSRYNMFTTSGIIKKIDLEAKRYEVVTGKLK